MNHFYEKLIDIVKGYKLIYDVNHKDYSDYQKKIETWNEIGLKLKTSGKECKRSWTLLRDSFRRSLKKKRDPQNPEKKWRYEDEMSFLIPYTKEKPHRFVVHDPITINSFEAVDPIHSPAVSEQSMPEPPGKKRKKEAPNSAELIKYILESQKGQPPDDIEKFFTGITSTVRSFPAIDKAIAKARIFQIVSDMEIDILNRSTAQSSNHVEAANEDRIECNDSIEFCSEPPIKTEIEY
ncbi:hypothetical protein ACJJTC_012525 [Scirpophaga incertulas]